MCYPAAGYLGPPMLQRQPHGWVARHAGRTLSSHFQPIYSLVDGQLAGYEGLLRVQQCNGEPESPLVLLSSPGSHCQHLHLDRLCRALHLANFSRQRHHPAWLFVNLNAQYLIEARPDTGFTEKLLQAHGLGADQLVVEIIESAVGDRHQLKRFIDHFRALGCRIAIDDFGAGHSNIDRIWQLEPDIVKLDRELIHAAAGSVRVERIFARLVDLLHESGSLVVVEGVETEREADISIAAGADLVQGYRFARPAACLPAQPGCPTLVAALRRARAVRPAAGAGQRGWSTGAGAVE